MVNQEFPNNREDDKLLRLAVELEQSPGLKLKDDNESLQLDASQLEEIDRFKGALSLLRDLKSESQNNSPETQAKDLFLRECLNIRGMRSIHDLASR